MKQLLTLTTGLLVLFASCSQESVEPVVQHNDSPVSSNCRSLDEGLESAAVLFDKMGLNTRSSARKVKSVETINQTTRSSSPEAAFYIVNYENNEGFVLLSADKRLEPVFAISEEGSMNLSDTVFNKPLAGYIRGIEKLSDEVTLSSIKPVTPDSTVVIKPLDLVVIVSHPLLGNEFSKSILPFFHTSSPFNKYCFTSSGQQAVVGCAELAAGTLMGYYQWPEKYGSHTFDWETMKYDQNHDSWAKLFSYIGMSDNMNSTYGVNKTTSSKLTYCRTFSNFGYKDMTLKSFSIDGVNSELSSQKPLMVRATDYSKQEYHEWIIDGAQYVEKALSIETPKQRTYYYHCVWGWGGKDNGYFIFNSNISVDNEYLFENLEYIANLQKRTN